MVAVIGEPLQAGHAFGQLLVCGLAHELVVIWKLRLHALDEATAIFDAFFVFLRIVLVAP